MGSASRCMMLSTNMKVQPLYLLFKSLQKTLNLHSTVVGNKKTAQSAIYN